MSAEENEMKNRHPADENEKTMPETSTSRSMLPCSSPT